MEKKRGESNSSSKVVPAEPEFATGTMEVHPLKIDLIIEKIFEYLFWPKGKPRVPKLSRINIDFTQAQKIRLVCKQWKDVGTRLFRRHRKSIRFDVDLSSCDRRRKPEELFLDVMKESSLIPVESYVVGPRLFGSRALFSDFLRVCGPPLVTARITISGYCTLNTSSFPAISLPSLKELAFRINWMKSPTTRLEGIVELLLKAAVNLEEFNLGFYHHREPDASMFTSFLRAVFRDLPPTTRALLLNNVPMDTTESEDLLRILNEQNLRLNQLEFCWRGSVRADSVLALLERQGPTLIQLFLGGLESNEESRVLNERPPPLLEKLPFRQVGASSSPFPRLLKFGLHKLSTDPVEADACHRILAKICGGTPDEPPLREVALPSHINADLTTKIGLQFPNIRRLYYRTSKLSTFSEFVPVAQAIFRHFLNLEILHVGYSFPVERGEGIFNLDNMDSLLTGIPEEDCARLRARRRDLEKMDVSGLQRTPSLLNLKKLRRLVLSKNNGTSFVIVTPLTAQLVFLPMQPLELFWVDKDAYHRQLSRKVRKSLDTKFKRKWGPYTDDNYVDWYF